MPVVDLEATERARSISVDDALRACKEFGRAQQLQLLVVSCCACRAYRLVAKPPERVQEGLYPCACNLAPSRLAHEHQ